MTQVYHKRNMMSSPSTSTPKGCQQQLFIWQKLTSVKQMSIINSIFEIMAYFTQRHYSQSFNIIKTFNIIVRNLHIRSAKSTYKNSPWHHLSAV